MAVIIWGFACFMVGVFFGAVVMALCAVSGRYRELEETEGCNDKKED